MWISALSNVSNTRTMAQTVNLASLCQLAISSNCVPVPIALYVTEARQQPMLPANAGEPLHQSLTGTRIGPPGTTCSA